MPSNETFDELCKRAADTIPITQVERVAGAAWIARAMARRAVEMARGRLFDSRTSSEFKAGYNAACGDIIADIAAFAGIEVDSER